MKLFYLLSNDSMEDTGVYRDSGASIVHNPQPLGARNLTVVHPRSAVTTVLHTARIRVPRLGWICVSPRVRVKIRVRIHVGDMSSTDRGASA